jgi:hypothetical protein
MSSPALTLPTELYSYVSDFLIRGDWEHFFLSCKTFDTLKLQTRYITLGGEKSLKFLTDEIFKNEILSKVNDRRHQLCLLLHNVSDKNLLVKANGMCHCIVLCRSTLTAIDCLTNVTKLVVMFCNNLTEITNFSELQQTEPEGVTIDQKTGEEIVNDGKEVSIYMCPEFTGFAYLKNLKSLKLYENDHLEAIPLIWKNSIALIELVYCKNLRDLSALGEETSTGASGTANEEDAARMETSTTATRATRASPAPSPAALAGDLPGRRITENEKVILVGCDKVEDLSPLKYVKQQISINSCHGIKHVLPLLTALPTDKPPLVIIEYSKNIVNDELKAYEGMKHISFLPYKVST